MNYLKSEKLLSKLSIAPMVDWSNSYFRILMRILAPKCLVYTEMYSCHTVIHKPKLLHFSRQEHPIALQIGGSDPKDMAKAAKIGELQKFDEVNINLGCPSVRVQSGNFGACLMKEPDRVKEILLAVKNEVSIPVTCKIRIGVDEMDSYACFEQFADMLVNNGCDKLVIHARKAWLHGLSPKQNRTVPPILYDRVYQYRNHLQSRNGEFVYIPIVINGDIQDYNNVISQFNNGMDGVMIGRLACTNPYEIARIHSLMFDTPLPTRSEILYAYLSQVDTELAQRFVPYSISLKPLHGLMHGVTHATAWRNCLSTIPKHLPFVEVRALLESMWKHMRLDSNN